MSQSKEQRVLPSEAEYDYVENFKLGFIFFQNRMLHLAAISMPAHLGGIHKEGSFSRPQ